MNRCKNNQCKYQNGAASLFTSVVLLIAITLVVFTSAKTILNETKISADQYRTSQATAAAQYAMDVGVNYFDTGGFDRLDETGGLVSAGGTVVLGNDGNLDSVADIDGDGVFEDPLSNLTLTSTDGSQITTANIQFFETNCGIKRATEFATDVSYIIKKIGTTDFSAIDQITRPSGFVYEPYVEFKATGPGTGNGEAYVKTDGMRNGLIVSTGYSDDGRAMRTITQCIGPLGILRNDGPKQPLVAQGNVALTGNARIINRFTNTTIWSGDKVTIGSSSAMETYIKDPDTGALDISNAADRAILLSTDEDVATQLISNNNLGNGLDIIDDDPSLGTLVGLEFFQNFFTIETRQQLKNLAGRQAYADIASAIASPPKSGLFWIGANDGSTSISMTGGQIGTLESPAIVYVNGDFTLGGNAIIYGLLYVGGKYTINGTPTVVGANIVEGTNLTTETPATAPIVTGTGTISLVYWAGFANGSSNALPGLSAVVSGSWRDW